VVDKVANRGRDDEVTLADRLASLQARLTELDSVVVAFSGGADSAFLLAAAVRALGSDRVVAATAVSSSLPSAELRLAAEFCAALGVRQLTPSTSEMERAGYRANAGDRCYFCKAELLDVLGPLADQLGFAAVATGTNADDAVAGFRPGIRAASERGAATPLLDAGLTKAEIREASREWGLPTWDKPAAACLSSRIAFGVEVTPTRLARVERSEVALREWLDAHRIAVRDLRVRDLGSVARVELDSAALSQVNAVPGHQAAVLTLVKAAGFPEVHLDARGFRSGSMNELLPNPDVFR
jgi:pyridinium-3,5-biscarboxylic acid mononucleotide sulfurtransferase